MKRASKWRATEANIHALHFGNYGGLPIRWAYFLLGLGGCALIFSGNLLWIESRRRKARANDPGPVVQSRSSRMLAAFGVGIPLGCISGIAVTIAAAKLLSGVVSDLPAWHFRIYYIVFGLAAVWPHLRGPARGGIELLRFSAGAMALIPLASLASALLPIGWNHGFGGLPVDLTALAGAVLALVLAARAERRSEGAPFDSLWHVRRAPIGPSPNKELVGEAAHKEGGHFAG